MKRNILLSGFFLFLIVATGLLGCRKNFLDAKPNQALSIPESPADFQSLLDNQKMYYNGPALGDISTDDYYLSYSTLQSETYLTQNCYTWTSNTYAGGSGTAVADWNQPYASIYVTNVVMDGLASVTSNNMAPSVIDGIRGAALFYRASNFYNLAQCFAQPFVQATAATDKGLPLRLSSNLMQTVSRSSVRQTYDQIVKDLLEAKDLLTDKPDLSNPNRPSKAAAIALLSRVYLTKQQYDSAFLYADAALNLYSNLLDYNTIDPKPVLPFPKLNPEIYLQVYQIPYGVLDIYPTTHVDSNLYRNYQPNDLRKSLYFGTNTDGSVYFRGTYSGLYYIFMGIAVDEIYLIRAECNARLNRTQSAMNDLNTLLVKRWKQGSFIPYTATDADDALVQILQERRKELLMRGIRWSDLRRLNQDPKFATTLARSENGTRYTLPPNDPRYTLLLPADEILYSNWAQNPR